MLELDLQVASEKVDTTGGVFLGKKLDTYTRNVNKHANCTPDL